MFSCVYIVWSFLFLFLGACEHYDTIGQFSSLQSPTLLIRKLFCFLFFKFQGKGRLGCERQLLKKPKKKKIQDQWKHFYLVYKSQIKQKEAASEVLFSPAFIVL